MPSYRCPWCGCMHESGYLLCFECELIAQESRRRWGLPVRQVGYAKEEPDD